MQTNRSRDFSKIGTVVRYLLVGGGTALLEMVLFIYFVYAFGCDLSISNVSAVFVATVTNFFLNKNYSFHSTRKFWFSALLYVLLFFFNLSFSTLVIEWAAIRGFSPVLAKLFTMVCIVIWNYVLYRKVVFRNG